MKGLKGSRGSERASIGHAGGSRAVTRSPLFSRIVKLQFGWPWQEIGSRATLRPTVAIKRAVSEVPACKGSDFVS